MKKAKKLALLQVLVILGSFHIWLIIKSYAYPVSLMNSIFHVADVTDYSNQSSFAAHSLTCNG